jgi:hypothetical protein
MRRNILERIIDRIDTELDFGASPRNLYVIQRKRFIDADVIGICNKWYRLVTDPNAVKDVDVISTVPDYRNGFENNEQITWLDENGRAIY